MNWEAIGAIGEIIGALAVFITLIYLSIQIKQNTRQLKLTSFNAIAEAGDRAFEPIYIPENTAIWHKGHADPASLTDEDWATFSLLMSRTIHNFQSFVYQNEQGAFDTDTYPTYLLLYSAFVQTAGGAKWYSENKRFFSVSTHTALERGARVDA